MEEQVKKRVRRTPEQIAAEIDAKIATLEQSLLDNDKKRDEAIQEVEQKNSEIKAKITAKIESLQKQKAKVLTPKPPRKPRKTKKQKIDEIVKKAAKSGLKPAEIAEKLGIEVSD